MVSVRISIVYIALYIFLRNMCVVVCVFLLIFSKYNSYEIDIAEGNFANKVKD